MRHEKKHPTVQPSSGILLSIHSMLRNVFATASKVPKTSIQYPSHSERENTPGFCVVRYSTPVAIANWAISCFGKSIGMVTHFCVVHDDCF
jgi:hypothetical protein